MSELVSRAAKVPAESNVERISVDPVGVRGLKQNCMNCYLGTVFSERREELGDGRAGIGVQRQMGCARTLDARCLGTEKQQQFLESCDSFEPIVECHRQSAPLWLPPGSGVRCLIETPQTPSIAYALYSARVE